MLSYPQRQRRYPGPYSQVPSKGTAFFDAVKKGDIDQVRAMIPHLRTDWNKARDHDGNTAFMLAAWCGHVKIVALLLDQGAKIEARNRVGYTALMVAVLTNHIYKQCSFY